MDSEFAVLGPPPTPTFDAQAETARWVQLWRIYDLDVVDDLFVTDSTVTAVWLFGDRTAPRDGVQRRPVTFVYAWRDGRWRIAHVHFANDG